jgi:hypothetical protein
VIDPALPLNLSELRPAVTARMTRAGTILLVTGIALVVSVFLPAAATTRGANIIPTVVVAVLVGIVLPPAMRTRIAAAVLPIVVAAVVSVVVQPLWSAAIQRRAESSAPALAGDRPYCIQVPIGPYGRGYRPTIAADELSGFRMQAPGTDGFWNEFHALLVIEDDTTIRFYNWSYRAGAFVPVTDSALASLYVRAQCDPRLHFVDGLAR